MNKDYIANNIFNEDGISLNDLITNLFISFLDEDFSLFNRKI